MFEKIIGLVTVILGIITFCLGHWNFSYDKENKDDIPLISLVLLILLLISGAVSIIGGSYIVLVGR